MATNEQPLSQYLDTVGDGTGAFNANGNYSVTPGVFIYRPPADQLVQMATFSVTVQDLLIVSGRYGNIVGGLNNGYTIRVKDDAGRDDPLFEGRVFNTNADFAAARGHVDVFDHGAGDKVLTAFWNTRDRFSVLVSLLGSKGERIEVTLTDDLSSLSEHLFQVQGYIDR